MSHLELLLLSMIAVVIGVRQGLHDARARHSSAAVRGSLAGQAVIPLLGALALVSLLRYLTLHRLGPPSALAFAALTVSVPFVVARALTSRAVPHTAMKSRSQNT